jgi:iron(II)-dependent oxidoreductase
MRRSLRKAFWNFYGASRVFWVGMAMAVLCAVVGWWLHNAYCFGGAAVVFCLLLARRAARAQKITQVNAEPIQTPPDTRPTQDRPRDTETLVASMLAQDRFAILLRPQLAKRLTADQVEAARGAMLDQMALVPGGTVVLSDEDSWNEDLDPDAVRRSRAELPNGSASGDSTFLVEPVFLDRNTVTNRQYYEFVASGGYTQLALWDQGIWPAVVGFVDRTNYPGPRGWVDGRYLPGEENLPIVGVNWHEASAYARWVGKRLPTDAEWVKAACWPVTIRADRSTQRRFPWGSSMDPDAANLWGNGPGNLVAVDAYPQGRSVGGLNQMVGNVWEWTLGAFDLATMIAESMDDQSDPMAHAVTGDVVLKNIRGGAYDTYFDGQATSQFRSGELSISRKHNIGFRCAIGACDLATAQAPVAQLPAEQTIPQDNLVDGGDQPLAATDLECGVPQ